MPLDHDIIAASDRQLTPTEERNKQVVLDVYDAIVNQWDFEKARQFIADGYRDHAPDIDGDIDSLYEYNVKFHAENPNVGIEIRRVLVDGDFVILHSLGRLNAEHKGTAIMDIFRLENGRIVEHWDVLQDLPDSSRNQSPMF